MANTIRWDTEAMESIAQKLNRLSSELASCKSTVRRIAAGMDQSSGGQLDYNRSTRLSMAGMWVGSASIKSCLSQYANALDRYDSLTSRLAINLKNAAREFEGTEHTLSKAFAQTGSESPFDFSYGTGAMLSGAVPAASAASAVVTDSTGPKVTIDWGKVALDSLGKFGYIGAIFHGAVTALDGSLESIAKGTTKAVGYIAKWAKDPTFEKIFGLNKFLEDPSDLGGLAGFGKNLKSGFVKGMKNSVKWATSFISAGFDNWEEHGEFSARFVAEWATETVGDVALYAGTAAVIGACAATAPAWAVGVGATIAVAGIDAAWKAITKSDDGIVKSIGHAIGSGVEWAWGKLFG